MLSPLKVFLSTFILAQNEERNLHNGKNSKIISCSATWPNKEGWIYHFPRGTCT